MAKQKERLEDKYRVNEQLQYERELYLVEDGNCDKIPYYRAQQKAQDAGEDLVEVSKKDGLPLTKIFNFEKFIYNEKKRLKENVRNRQEVKEIQLSANIQSNDMEYRVRNCRKWLEEGAVVKVVLKLRGRELNNVEFNQKSIYEFIELCDEFASPMSVPKLEGKQMVTTLKFKK